MITSQPGFSFYEASDRPTVDADSRWRSGDDPRSIQENSIHGAASSRELAVLLLRTYVTTEGDLIIGCVDGQAQLARADSPDMKPGQRELIPKTRLPLEIMRNREDGERVFGEPSFVGKIGSGLEYIYVFRAKDADPDSQNPNDYLCFFGDTEKGRVTEPQITEVTGSSLQLLNPVFREGDQDEVYLSRVLRRDEKTHRYSLEASVASGWENRVYNVVPELHAVDHYEQRLRDAAALESTLDLVTNPTAVDSRSMVDKFMLDVVGHRDPDVRRVEGLPGDDYMLPIALGFTAGENGMTLAIRGRSSDASTREAEYQVTVGDLANGEMDNGRIVHFDHTRDGWYWMDVIAQGRKVNIRYRIGETGAAYDVHCSIDGGATANDNVRPIAELVDGIEDRMGSSLGEVVAMDRLSDRFAKLITTNSNAARVLDGFASKYAGSLARDGSSYHSEDLPVIEGSESHDTVIGTVFLGVDGEPGGRVCHIRCNRADGVGDRPEDYVVDIADLHDVFDLNLDAGVEVNWLSTEIDDRGRTILRIGLNLIDLGDVQISCVLDENGQGSEFSIHKLNRRLGPLPTLDRVLERVQHIEQERRERDGGDVGRRAVDAALVAA